jgi:hypothetical protein
LSFATRISTARFAVLFVLNGSLRSLQAEIEVCKRKLPSAPDTPLSQ